MSATTRNSDRWATTRPGVQAQIAADILTKHQPPTIVEGPGDVAHFVAEAQHLGAAVFAHAFLSGYADHWRRRADTYRLAGLDHDADVCETYAAALDQLADTYTPDR
jgi:hypothetical protein